MVYTDYTIKRMSGLILFDFSSKLAKNSSAYLLPHGLLSTVSYIDIDIANREPTRPTCFKLRFFLPQYHCLTLTCCFLLEIFNNINFCVKFLKLNLAAFITICSILDEHISSEKLVIVNAVCKGLTSNPF